MPVPTAPVFRHRLNLALCRNNDSTWFQLWKDNDVTKYKTIREMLLAHVYRCRHVYAVYKLSSATSNNPALSFCERRIKQHISRYICEKWQRLLIAFSIPFQQNCKYYLLSW
jgi:hypothetical protein